MVYSLWFRTTFTGHIFIHSVSPLLEIHFAATSACAVLRGLRHFHSVQLKSAPSGSSSLALMDMVIDEGKLASLSFHNVSLMIVASVGLTALRKLSCTSVDSLPVCGQIEDVAHQLIVGAALCCLLHTGKLCHRGKCHSGNCHSGERWMSRPFVHSGNLNFKHTLTNDLVFHNA